VSLLKDSGDFFIEEKKPFAKKAPFRALVQKCKRKIKAM
jgi:hypothetical protein